MANTLSTRRSAAKAVVAAVAFSAFSSPSLALADQCSYSVAKKASGNNVIKYNGGLESVTVSVQAGKGESLEITIPGGFVDGAQGGKSAAAVIFANTSVAIDVYLGGKKSSQWECVTEPPATSSGPYTSAEPHGATVSASEASGWIVPGTETARPQSAPAAATETAPETKAAAGRVQLIVASADVDTRKAEKLLAKGKLGGKKLDEARAAVQKRENSILLAMYEARSSFMVLPAYKHWKYAHDRLSSGAASQDDLNAANDNLDAAAAELGKPKPYPRNYTSDPESIQALGVIETTYNERDKGKRDAKREAESSRLQDYIEKVYGKYPPDGQSDADKLTLLQETVNAKNLAVVRRKVEKREIVASQKSYTPGGKGAAIADEAALAAEVFGLTGRTVKGDYDLQFHCVIEAHITVDGAGHALKVSFPKGPAGYLDNQEFLQALSDTIGRFGKWPGKGNTTYVKPFKFF